MDPSRIHLKLGVISSYAVAGRQADMESEWRKPEYLFGF